MERFTQQQTKPKPPSCTSCLELTDSSHSCSRHLSPSSRHVEHFHCCLLRYRQPRRVSQPEAGHTPLQTLAESFSKWIDCGHTASEARDRGCIFDLMLSTWIHESCYDGEMMNRYLLEGNHTYFYDEDMLHEMPEEEARRGEYKTLWTDGEFHLRHCVYLMDMQLRSYVTGRPIEVSIYNFRHTQHCVNMTLWHDRDGKKTRLHALLGKCGFPKDKMIIWIIKWWP